MDSFDFDIYNLGGKLGYYFNDYLGAEVQGSFGVTEKNNEKVDYAAGAFGVVRFPAGESFDIFARGGWYFAQIGNDVLNLTADFDGFGVGGGGQLFFTENDGIRLEYTYLDGDGGGADTFSVSYVRNF